MAYISSANIGSRTNGQRSFTHFNVTQGPRGGEIYLNDAPASIFSQINIDNEEVVYMQSDMSLSNDTFLATITNQVSSKLKTIHYIQGCIAANSLVEVDN